MQGFPKRRVRIEHGQSLVEFSLLLPVLMLVIFAIFEFGNLFRVQVELQNAAREGARYMAINASDLSLQSHVQNAVQTHAPDLSNLSVTSCYPTTGSSSCGSTSTCSSTTVSAPWEVKVSVSYSYTPITPVGYFIQKFGGSFGSALTLTAASTMNNEC